MEKLQAAGQKSSKSIKIFKYLPKAAQAAVSFQNPPPFSPGLPEKRYDGKLKTPTGKAFSGPIISMIPAEARGRMKNFDTAEPTSPKVSCIGQVRHKKAVYCKKQVSMPKELFMPDRVVVSGSRPEPDNTKKKPSGMKRIFGSRRKHDGGGAPPPCLAEMRRFASSRDALADFDWTSGDLIATPDTRGSCSDEDDYGGDSKNDVVIPFSASAPILVAVSGLASEPRKEINLWKRRAMAAQPKPLQLNLVRA
ncbi:uncharacterized protein At1g76070-like [Andrographis paniculata]|uniref:uncharacterized protein At1g76070-like n=1 Tax=Andrographis paniculata TaxID=175694 RepID=UPI0021E88CB7|nr:uncharacterized protein At1g76070-like [Andrographis paniculata]